MSKHIPAKEFQKIWNGSKSPTEAGATMGRSRNSVCCTASKLRRRGYSLRPFNGSPFVQGPSYEPPPIEITRKKKTIRDENMANMADGVVE